MRPFAASFAPAPTPAPPPAPASRLIGRHRGQRPGPLVLAIGGLHGNEPAGVRALERVLAALAALSPPMRGEFTGLAGNLVALRAGVRFLRRDLNRAWRPARVAGLRASGGTLPEEEEQLHLLDAIEDILRGREDEACVLDLHTTSSDSAPFLTLGDTLPNRRFARRLGLPLVLGIEERIGGALLEFLNERGAVTVGVEAGRHDDPVAVDHHEAVLWVALVEAGCLAPADVPGYEELREKLARARGDLPAVFEVRHRHGVAPGDGFVMRPGFVNFQPVRRGDEVARDFRGAIRVPESGRIFLPLYQALGDDGFFLVRPVHLFWLHVSATLRRLKLDRLAPHLPGVRRSRRRSGTVIVDRAVARWRVLEVFHLLGYRQTRATARRVVLRRRRNDRTARGERGGRR